MISGIGHTTENDSYDARKERDKGDLEDRVLVFEDITRLEDIVDVNALMGPNYVQDRPCCEEVNAYSTRVSKKKTYWYEIIRRKREKEMDLQNHYGNTQL